MSNTVDALVLDLLEWLGPAPRPYAEVLDAWRTSCPKLPIWEEANARGFIDRVRVPGGEVAVAVSIAGADFLDGQRPGRRGALRTPDAGAADLTKMALSVRPT